MSTETPNSEELFAQFTNLIGYLNEARSIDPNEWPWPVRLLIIWLGYSSIAVPAAILIYYVKKQYANGNFQPKTALSRFIESFAIGYANYTTLPNSSQTKKKEEVRSFTSDCFWFTIDAGGIMATMLMMGWLQERIITKQYTRISDPLQSDNFSDMQFLVFCNRMVALLVSAIVLILTRRNQPPHVPPYYVHSYTSFANTMSSWCQYEALKFVSFPTQTICKVSKVVATMLMGKVVRGQSYSWSEYLTGAGIAIGSGIFLLNTGEHSHLGVTTSISGMILMVGYLVFDSFTLNWQKVLFDTKPKVSKNQMMFGVNAFSVILTLVSLLEQGTLWTSINFALTHHSFLAHNFLMSLCSAIGQLFIYSTIERFGPIVFAVIMTVRQMGSILLSTISYSHPMTIWSGVGLLIAFSTMFVDIYRRYFEKKSSASASTA